MRARAHTHDIFKRLTSVCRAGTGSSMRHYDTWTIKSELKHTYLGQNELSVNHTPTPAAVLNPKGDNPVQKDPVEIHFDQHNAERASDDRHSLPHQHRGQQPINGRHFFIALLWLRLLPGSSHKASQLYLLPRWAEPWSTNCFFVPQVGVNLNIQ